jgi:hypothetical protein
MTAIEKSKAMELAVKTKLFMLRESGGNAAVVMEAAEQIWAAIQMAVDALGDPRDGFKHNGRPSEFDRLMDGPTVGGKPPTTFDA